MGLGELVRISHRDMDVAAGYEWTHQFFMECSGAMGVEAGFRQLLTLGLRPAGGASGLILSSAWCASLPVLLFSDRFCVRKCG